MPSTAPRTVVVAAAAAGVVAAAGAPASAPVLEADAAPYDPTEDTAASAPVASGAVLIPARVAAHTAAYAAAAAAAAIAQRQSALRFTPRLTPEEKEIVINVYQYVTRVWPATRHSSRDCTEKISEITGLAKPEIYRFLRDRRMTRTVEVPMNLAVAWERMYRYYHEMENGMFRPENVDHDKDLVLPEYCMWMLNRILRHLSSRRRYGSRGETPTVPNE